MMKNFTQYSGPNWCYESLMPEWSKTDFEVPKFYDMYVTDRPNNKVST